MMNGPGGMSLINMIEEDGGRPTRHLFDLPPTACGSSGHADRTSLSPLLSIHGSGHSNLETKGRRVEGMVIHGQSSTFDDALDIHHLRPATKQSIKVARSPCMKDVGVRQNERRGTRQLMYNRKFDLLTTIKQNAWFSLPMNPIRTFSFTYLHIYAPSLAIRGRSILIISSKIIHDKFVTLPLSRINDWVR